VANGIGVARAFGDFPMRPAIGTEPYYSNRKISPGDKYLVLACDGIWDVLTNQNAADIVSKHATKSLGFAAHTLRGWAYSLGSGDDLSVIVVAL